MVLTQVVRWADNTADLKRNLAQGLDQIEAVRAGAEKMVNAMRGDKLIESAHRMVAAIGLLDKGVKSLAPQEAASRLAFLERAIDKLERTGGKVPTQFRQMAEALRQVAPQAGILSSAFGRLTAAFTAANLIDRAITGVVSMGTAAFASASRIVDLSKKTGLSIEGVQRLGHVAQQSGGTIEQYADAVFKLGVSMDVGGKKSVEALTGIGLSLDAIQKLKPEQQFDMIVRALSSVTNSQERNRLGVDLMGKAYAGVAASIDDYANLMSKAQVATERNVRVASDAKNAWDGFLAAIGAGFINVVGTAISELDKLSNAAAKSNQFMFATADRIAQIRREQAIAAGTLVPGDINLTAQSNVNRSSDFVRDLAEARAEIGRLTQAQRVQLNAAIDLGKSTEELSEKFNLSEAALRFYNGQTKDIAKHSREAAAELERFKQEQERIFGIDVINRALAFKDQLRGVNDLSSLMPEIQAEILASMERAIDVYQRAGDQAPRSLLKIRDALRDIADVDLGVVADTVTSQVNATADALGFFMHATEALRTGVKVGRQAQEAIAGVGVTVTDSLSKVRTALDNMADINDEWVMRFGSGLEQAKLRADRWRQHAMGLIAHLKDTLPELWQQTVDKINDITQGMVDEFETQAQKIKRVMMDAVQSGIIGGLGAAAGASSGRDAVRSFGTTLLNSIPVAGPILGSLFGSLFDDSGDVAARQSRVDKAIRRVQDGINALTSATERFGGAVPNAMRPFLDSLLKSNRLTGEMRQQLEALGGVPSLDALREAAQRYGRTLDQLGPKLAQFDLSDTFDQIFTDFTMLSDAGADTTSLFEAMADSVNAALDRARRLGLAVPEFMRPMLQSMLKMGLLTDEFGTQLDTLNGFTFSDSIESSLGRIAEILERIEKALSHPLLPEVFGRGIGDAPPIGLAGPRSPSGAGTMTLNVEMNGQTIARAITPFLPGEVQTLRLAP